MTAYVADTFPERGERIQLMALACAVHLIVLGVLVFSVSFKHHAPPEASMVDLWQALPDDPAPALPPPPVPVVTPPPAAKPVKVVPPPVVTPPVKPDIAFKEQKAADKADKADKKKPPEDKKPPDDKALQQKQKQQAEAQQIAQEKAEAQKQQQAAAARNKLRDEYVGKIRDRIKRFIVKPPNLDGNPQAEFDVTLLPGGGVLSVRLTQSSGVPAYDSAIERAILKAQPLPLPDDPTLFNDFRELNLTFRPQE